LGGGVRPRAPGPGPGCSLRLELRHHDDDPTQAYHWFSDRMPAAIT
jgi:hypothetical protein